MKNRQIERHINDILGRLALDKAGRDKVRTDIEATLAPLVEQYGVEGALQRFGTPQEVAEAFAESGYRLRTPEPGRAWKVAVSALLVALLGAGFLIWQHDRRAEQIERERDKVADKLDAVVRDLKQNPVPQPGPAPQPETGIIESREAFPNITTGMLIRNRWQANLPSGNQLIVFAGSFDGQGAVLLVEWTPEKSLARNERYPAPGDHGPVRIVAEEQNRLILEAEDGTRFAFDVTSGSYDIQ